MTVIFVIGAVITKLISRNSKVSYRPIKNQHESYEILVSGFYRQGGCFGSEDQFPYIGNNHVKRRDKYQCNHSGEDNTEAERYGHGNEEFCLPGCFEHHGRKPAKGSKCGEHDRPETLDPRIVNGFDACNSIMSSFVSKVYHDKRVIYYHAG